MGTDGANRTANKIPLPLPTTFSISILKSTGANQQEFPTFSISYLGALTSPSDEVIGDFHNFMVNFEPTPEETTTTLEIVGFLQPRKELLDFADSWFLKIPVPVHETSELFKKIAEVGRYVVIISTEVFCYRALVEDSGGEVLESSIDYRYLL